MNWLLAGSEGGGQTAAIAYTLIESAKLNVIDPQASLADVFTRIAGYPASRIGAPCHGTASAEPARPSSADTYPSHHSKVGVKGEAV